MNTRQRGIALIQVLLLSGILGLLMLQLGLTARGQIARAAALSTRAEAELFARSREAALVYTLLTEPLRRVPESANPYSAAWNFHGEPFSVDGVRFSIQDQSGLMRVPLYGANEFKTLLVSLGVEGRRASALGTQLMQLQLGSNDDGAGASRLAWPIQTLDDLRRLPDMDEALFLRLRPLVTLYPTPGLNPLTAPVPLLGMRMPASQQEAVLALRRQDQLDANSLWKVTSIDADESTVIAPGPGFAVTTLAAHDGVELRRETIYVVRPYRDDAVAVWQRQNAATESEWPR